ncbi:hypothetical protein Pla175_18060 [Pirellulimonas nuda]|uniref:MoxR-vWA-beta-propeller ternary system domain-containing protein n=1 Tax=Pirellulimonas nuda TaxID=2528009 RepID=A0A518DAE6_9BACT|nr:hypothetical protein [Pirellulimonas nuda]QDU88428.1 hypothetical protein Pla175_18060 [Pirellulimonas nuda]
MLSPFVDDLLNGRPVRVGPPQAANRLDLQAAATRLEAFEREYRLELPGDPPGFDPAAALWAAVSLYLASSLAIHRDSELSAINGAAPSPLPDRMRAASHYSVDLTMRFLPSLLKLAKRASSDDPLLGRLMQWGRDWPLSSVGIAGIGDVDASTLRTSPTLLRLYSDRILASGDASRLNDATVRRAAAAAIGDYPELSPAIAEALSGNEQPIATTARDE